MHPSGLAGNDVRAPTPTRFGPSAVTRLCQALLAAVSLATPLWAQQGVVDKRLVLTIAPEYGVARGHAPLAISVSLRWLAAELIEGDLQLEWFVEQTKLGRYVAGDLALAESSLNLSVLLPPVILSHDEAIFSVQGKFITKDAVYDLDEHDVALQPDWRRILLVGICGAPQQMTDSRIDMLANEQQATLPRAFDLEPFFEQRFTRRELLVNDTDVDPADVPTDPLKMTAFDLFVIPGESIAKLKPAQLDCLLRWVKAGGSLCVFVDSAVPQSHVAWLNRLAGRDLAEAAYLSDGDGRVVATDEAADNLQEYYVGLGRSVVALELADAASNEWEQAVLFLWKVRTDRREASLKGDGWNVESARQRPAADNLGLRPAYVPLPAPRFGEYVDMEPQRIWRKSQLTDLLLPDSVRGLPLGTVCLILVLFLLAIAPGDYLLLGWLKRRRWTWVLFPVLSLVFTGYTMWTARQHLGKTSFERSITVIDVGEDGRPIRTSRFEMLYTAANRQVLTDAQNMLMVPLDPDVAELFRARFESGTPQQYEQPWTFTGRVPRKYTVSRDIPQWAPRLARVTSFGPPQDADRDQPVSGIDWSLLDADDRRGLLTFGPAYALRVSSGGTRSLFPEPTFIPTAIIELASSITHRRPTGFFSVVSQLSPTAGGNWEDLALLDSSDPDQEVLVVIWNPEEGQYVIFRRFIPEQD